MISVSALQRQILKYDFTSHDFSSSQIVDLSGNGNHGEAFNLKAITKDNVKQAYFDGKSSYIHIPRKLLKPNVKCIIRMNAAIASVPNVFGCLFTSNNINTHNGVQVDAYGNESYVSMAYNINNSWNAFTKTTISFRVNTNHNFHIELDNRIGGSTKLAQDGYYYGTPGVITQLPSPFNDDYIIGKYNGTNDRYLEMYLKEITITEYINPKSAIVEPETNDMYSLTPTNQPVVIGNMDSDVSLIKDTLLKDGKDITELGKNILPNYKKNSFKITTLVP